MWPDRVPDDRFFFLHLQKTAGTALTRRLRHHFGDRAVYPGPGDGAPPESVLSVSHLLERWQARAPEIRMVTGHFPLCTTELLGTEFTTLTVLRDPVERTLSYLRHHREVTPEDGHRSLEDIYEDPVRFELVHNHLVKMLSLRPREMTDGALTPVEFGPARLAEAKQRLGTIDVVGFQHRFDEFCERLTRRFGWDLGPSIFMNRSDETAVAESFRARIALDNADDLELFDFALRRDQ